MLEVIVTPSDLGQVVLDRIVELIECRCRLIDCVFK